MKYLKLMRDFIYLLNKQDATIRVLKYANSKLFNAELCRYFAEKTYQSLKDIGVSHENIDRAMELSEEWLNLKKNGASKSALEAVEFECGKIAMRLGDYREDVLAWEKNSATNFIADKVNVIAWSIDVIFCPGRSPRSGELINPFPIRYCLEFYSNDYLNLEAERPRLMVEYLESEAFAQSQFAQKEP